MKSELIEQAEKEHVTREAEFKDMVFANNPKLYEALWPQASDDGIGNENFEWIVPENEEEAKRLFSELMG